MSKDPEILLHPNRLQHTMSDITGSEFDSSTKAASMPPPSPDSEDETPLPTRGSQTILDNRKRAPATWGPAANNLKAAAEEEPRSLASVLRYPTPCSNEPDSFLVRASGSSAVISNSSNSYGTCDPITSVWQNKHVTKSTTAQEWKCTLCVRTFSGVNATKALIHLSHIKGPKDGNAHVSFCPQISPPVRLVYAALKRKSMRQIENRERSEQMIAARVDDDNHAGSQALEARRQKSSASVKKLSAEEIYARRAARYATHPTDGIALVQQSFLASNESMLTMAIADLIHSHGLSFIFAESARFKKVLTLAKLAGKKYNPPNGEMVRGELMDVNFVRHTNRVRKDLETDKEIYGLSLFGDAATVRKMPMINILASGIHSSAACLSIVNCSQQMIRGKKDGAYIARLFMPHLKELDPHKEDVDCLYFDGGSNFQLAGKILQAQYPRISVLHGVEHLSALFFSDIAKHPEVKDMIQVYRIIYGVFGNGSHHKPHAILKGEAKKANNGREIGLIRAADTRMAGYFIAFHRMYRLKGALRSAANSLEFANIIGLKKKDAVIAFLSDNQFYDRIYLLICMIYPILRILRLADSNTPNMDKLYYYIRQTNRALDSNDLKDKLDEMYETRLLSPKDSQEEEEIHNAMSGKGSPMASHADEEPSQLPLSVRIRTVWEKRSAMMVSDWAVAGWMLSVVPEIMADARAHHTSKHRRAVEALIDQLYRCEGPTKLGHMKNKFWVEWEQFQQRAGDGFGRPWIWESPELRAGRSFEWHKLNSIPYTGVLGRLACRVCSKILGIGAAERAWGDVKHLKDGQRAHLQVNSLRKQTTLFGAACMDKARMIREHRDPASNGDGVYTWDDEEMMYDMNFSKWDVDVPRERLLARVFRAWQEDWEVPLLKKRDCPIAKTKLMMKYGGLTMIHLDLDSKNNGTGRELYIRPDDIHWRLYTGWCVMGRNEDPAKDKQEVVLGHEIVFDGIAEATRRGLNNRVRVIRDKAHDDMSVLPLYDIGNEKRSSHSDDHEDSGSEPEDLSSDSDESVDESEESEEERVLVVQKVSRKRTRSRKRQVASDDGSDESEDSEEEPLEVSKKASRKRTRSSKG
jgi:hypothetical protein